jgi:hypothetical protein
MQDGGAAVLRNRPRAYGPLLAAFRSGEGGAMTELIDVRGETKQTLDMYGAEPGRPSFANNCLLARRLVERGVRFIQLYHTDWDHHGDAGNNLEGGLDYLKGVLIQDTLGLGAELEAQMQHVVDTYQCEWKTAVNDPTTRQRFRSFVNSEKKDEHIVFVEERGQIRPARADEREEQTA